MPRENMICANCREVSNGCKCDDKYKFRHEPRMEIPKKNQTQKWKKFLEKRGTYKDIDQESYIDYVYEHNKWSLFYANYKWNDIKNELKPHLSVKERWKKINLKKYSNGEDIPLTYISKEEINGLKKLGLKYEDITKLYRPPMYMSMDRLVVLHNVAERINKQ